MATAEGVRPTVLVVDRPSAVCDHLTEWLAAKGFRPICVHDEHKAMAVVRTIAVDVALVDLDLPTPDGLDLMQAIRDVDQAAQVIVMATPGNLDRAIEALRQGRAFDFMQVPKPDYPLLKETIDLALTRRRRLQAAIRQAQSNGDNPASPLAALTARERHILQLLIQGYENRKIADRLCLSEKTVRNHLTQVYQKLGVSNRTQAVLACQNHNSF